MCSCIIDVICDKIRTKVREGEKRMNKIKIIHMADLHFDTPFSGLEEHISKENKLELREAFNNIIKVSIKEEVKIILISGDLFDNYTLSRKTLLFIEETLSKIKDIKVFISPGNHDPYNEKSFYDLVKWPSNVYIFKGEMEKVYLKEYNTTIYGCAFNQNYVRESMLKDIGVDNTINIMVMHGEIATSSNKNEYNPITIKEIEESKMDYIALGHRHTYSGINKAGNTYYAYSGCPQGRGFDEQGKKGVIIGEISKEYVNLKFHQISKREYIEERVDVSNLSNIWEIKNKILKTIDEEKRNKNFYKIILYGNLNERDRKSVV